MTVIGRNINFIENQVQDFSILIINLPKFKKNYKFIETKDEDAWKVRFVNVKQNILHFGQDKEQNWMDYLLLANVSLILNISTHLTNPVRYPLG